MASILCQVCRSQFDMTRRDAKYVFDAAEFICSAECLKEFIEQYDPKPLPTKGIRWFTDIEMKNQRGERTIWSRDLNEFFRSEWELIVAGFLTFSGIPYVYEGAAIKVGHAHYIPDFFLPDKNLFLEVKGLWLAGSKAKLKKVERDCSDINFIVVPWVLRRSLLTYMKTRKRAFEAGGQINGTTNCK
jgi:hypothetical protein